MGKLSCIEINIEKLGKTQIILDIFNIQFLKFTLFLALVIFVFDNFFLFDFWKNHNEWGGFLLRAHTHTHTQQQQTNKLTK